MGDTPPHARSYQYSIGGMYKSDRHSPTRPELPHAELAALADYETLPHTPGATPHLDRALRGGLDTPPHARSYPQAG